MVPRPSNAQNLSPLRSFNVLGGYSFTSVQFLGKTANSQTQILSFGYQQKIRDYPNQKTLWYTADIIPYLHYQYPKRDEGDRFVRRSGFGFSPVGFMLKKSTSNIVTPFFRTSGGIIYMENEFPTDQSRRLNFTFDVTAGGNLHITPNIFISFGYKFHHISNAQTGSENPGLDSNFLFLKLSLQ
ncbi:MAG: acyloxyacyl hydrolase [Balneolaceae bacterium]